MSNARTPQPGEIWGTDSLRAEKAEVERPRTDLARMTERAEGAEVAWTDTITERDEALAAIERVRVALSNHPRCDRHPDGGPVTCGWKRAVIDVQHALDGGDSQ